MIRTWGVLGRASAEHKGDWRRQAMCIFGAARFNLQGNVMWRRPTITALSMW